MSEAKTHCQLCGAKPGVPHHDPIAKGRITTLHRLKLEDRTVTACMLCREGCYSLRRWERQLRIHLCACGSYEAECLCEAAERQPDPEVLRRLLSTSAAGPLQRRKKELLQVCRCGVDPQGRGAQEVHIRLGETLKAFKGEPVSAATLEFVANQDDWKKRIRELRYLGWNIKTFNRKLPGGRVSSFYRLVKSQPWPEDPTGHIRRYELERAERHRSER